MFSLDNASGFSCVVESLIACWYCFVFKTAALISLTDKDALIHLLICFVYILLPDMQLYAASKLQVRGTSVCKKFAKSVRVSQFVTSLPSITYLLMHELLCC